MYQLSVWEVALGVAVAITVFAALLWLRDRLRPGRRAGDQYDGW